MAASRAPKPAGYHWDVKDKVILPCGSKPCRWCKGPITNKRRQTFCSTPCVEQWNRRQYPDVLRWEIYERDQGVCRLCGLDMKWLDYKLLRGQLYFARCVVIGRLKADYAGLWLDDQGRPWPESFWLGKMTDREVWMLDRGIRPGSHTWEIDHIVPVVEGGDYFDPDNLRVLCRPCHWGESAKLAARLAAARRAVLT